MNTDNQNIFALISGWSEKGHHAALAIVISTWGSSPRQAGSMMAVRDDGLIEGSVSGGCVESSVIHSAMRLIAESGTETLEFGVADETAWQAGLSCGGRISVWVCPVSAMQEHLPALAADMIASRTPLHIDCLMERQHMQLGTSDKINSLSDDAGTFHLSVLPQPRIIIIGAVHISQHLAPMARATGFDVTIIDPRTSFANEARFADTKLICDWPQDVLDSKMINSDSAIITLTHDPKIDDEALKIILRGKPFYIACLGSKKTHNARRARLGGYGFSDAVIDQIHGPAGVDIGAKTPAEIAVSVLAELIAAYRKADR